MVSRFKITYCFAVVLRDGALVEFLICEEFSAVVWDRGQCRNVRNWVFDVLTTRNSLKVSRWLFTSVFEQVDLRPTVGWQTLAVIDLFRPKLLFIIIILWDCSRKGYLIGIEKEMLQISKKIATLDAMEIEMSVD